MSPPVNRMKPVPLPAASFGKPMESELKKKLKQLEQDIEAVRREAEDKGHTLIIILLTLILIIK